MQEQPDEKWKMIVSSQRFVIFQLPNWLPSFDVEWSGQFMPLGKFEYGKSYVLKTFFLKKIS